MSSKELVLNEYFKLEKNPEYWDADNVIIEEVTGLIINDANTALARYKAGEFDMMDDLPAGQYPALQGRDAGPDQLGSAALLVLLRDQLHRLGQRPALQDVNVRKALSYALDRDVIIDQVIKGGQTPAYNFAHAKVAGFEMPTIDYGTWTQAERDEKAKELMTEAGYGTGGKPLSLKLIYNTSESHKAIATVASQMWKQKLGVDINLENMEWQTYLDVRSKQNFDLARSGWCADYNEASTFLDLVTTTHGSNDGKYSNAEVDKLMAESKTESDPQANYTKVEQILAEEMAIIPIYHYSQDFLLSADIKGWPLNNAENNWYVKNIYRVSE